MISQAARSGLRDSKEAEAYLLGMIQDGNLNNPNNPFDRYRIFQSKQLVCFGKLSHLLMEWLYMLIKLSILM